MYAGMQVCMSGYMSRYVQACVHASACIHERACVYVNMCQLVCAHVSMRLCACHIHAYARVCTPLYARICMLIYTSWPSLLILGNLALGQNTRERLLRVCRLCTSTVVVVVVVIVVIVFLEVEYKVRFQGHRRVT